MKKIIIAALVLIMAGGGFWIWRSKKKSKESAASATRIVAVEKGALERTVEATGEVTPMNRVEIKPPISGRIEELLAEEGDTVKRGQLLAWMSSSDRAAILDAARAKGPAEVKKWEDSYKPTPIVAPLSGVLILKNVVVGQTVDAGTILFAMSDKLIVLARVDEADIGRVRLNVPARIVLDAYPDQTIEGTVSQILYEGKNVSNVITYGVKVLPKDAPPFFRSQMTANVTLILERKEDVLTIPSDAISGGGNGPNVMLPGPDGKPVPHAIEIGIQSGNRVEVTGGLNEGDKIVITRGKYRPQQSAQQSPLNFNPPAKQAQQNRARDGQKQR